MSANSIYIKSTLFVLLSLTWLSTDGLSQEPSATVSEIEALIEKLKSGDSSDRNSAVIQLGKIGDKRAVSPLIPLLEDKEWNVRESAAQALGLIGDERAVEPLIAALKVEKLQIVSDADIRVRVHAAIALGKIGNEQAVIPLLKAMVNGRSAAKSFSKKAKEEQRWEGLPSALMESSSAAAYSLGEIGDKRAVKYLIDVLMDTEWSFGRASAAKALGLIGDKQAVGSLIDTLKDKDSDICIASIWALGQIGDPSAVEPLLSAGDGRWGGISKAATEAIVEIVKDDISPLIDALNKKNSTITFRAMEILGQLKEKRAVIPLITMLQKISTRNYYSQRDAARALGEIGDERAVKYLIVALSDVSYGVREQAAISLGMIGGRQATEALISKLTDKGIYRIAAKTLQEIQWEPKTTAQKVHYYIGLRNKAMKEERNWKAVKLVLMQDLRSGSPKKIEYAIYAFTIIGNDSILPELLEFIRTRGTKTIALAYLNCNHQELRNAAQLWGTKHGYVIHTTPGYVETWNWGSL